jgi:hypothetical protein
MATGLRAIILAGLAIGGVGGFIVPDLNLNDAVAIQDRGEQALSSYDEPFGALHAAAIAKRGPSKVDAVQNMPEALGEAEEREATLAKPAEMRASESPPVHLAALTPPDEVHHDARDEQNDIKTADECLASDLCIDQYLWSLYQRARKVDTIKVVEQKKASVVKKGKNCKVGARGFHMEGPGSGRKGRNGTNGLRPWRGGSQLQASTVSCSSSNG